MIISVIAGMDKNRLIGQGQPVAVETARRYETLPTTYIGQACVDGT